MQNQNYCQLTHLSCLQLSGVDARAFLHSQLTVDVLALSHGESRLAAYCDPKGRVLSSLVLACLSDDFYLVLPKVLVDIVQETLQRYRMRAKVEITPTQELQLLGSFMADSDAELQWPHPLDSQRSFILADTNTHSSGELGKWELADIESGMVWLDKHSSLQQLPQSLGLVDNGAVDFDKGCYPGQEIVARLKYLGKSKLSLYKITAKLLASNDLAAVTIRTGEGIKQGQLLNFQLNAGNVTALAVIRDSSVSVKNELFLHSEHGVVLSQSLKISF